MYLDDMVLMCLIFIGNGLKGCQCIFIPFKCIGIFFVLFNYWYLLFCGLSDNVPPMHALAFPPPRWSFPEQQPEQARAPSSQLPSGEKPTAAKSLWVADCCGRICF